MGWRRVRVVGTCGAEEEAGKLSELLNAVPRPGYNFESFGPLCTIGDLRGLSNWGKPSFDVVGNLAERDYDVESVVAHLTELSVECPSLAAVVHVGDVNEADDVVATVTVSRRVVTTVQATEGKLTVDKLPPMTTPNPELLRRFGL